MVSSYVIIILDELLVKWELNLLAFLLELANKT